MKFIFTLTALLLIPQVAFAGDIGFAWLAIYDLSKVYFIPMVFVQLLVFFHYLKSIHPYKFGLWLVYLNALVTYVIAPIIFLLWGAFVFAAVFIPLSSQNLPSTLQDNIIFHTFLEFLFLPLYHPNAGIAVVLALAFVMFFISYLFMVFIIKRVIKNSTEAKKMSFMANAISYAIVLFCIFLVFYSGWYKDFEYLKPYYNR